MARRTTVSPRPTKRPEHAHCEWRNDRHVGYCREAAHRVFRHPRGMAGILFTCDAHALDALADGKELPVEGRP